MPALWDGSFKAANRWTLRVCVRRESWPGLWVLPSEAALIVFTSVWVHTVIHNTFSAIWYQDAQGGIRNHWVGGDHSCPCPAPSLDGNINPEKGEWGNCNTHEGHCTSEIRCWHTVLKLLRLPDTVLNFIYKWGNGSSEMTCLSFALGTRTVISWHSSSHFLLYQMLFTFIFIYTYTHPKQPFKLM